MTTSLSVSRRIAAPAARLFDAWLDPASLARWMRRDGGEPSIVVADPRIGGSFSITMLDRFGVSVHVGTYTEIDRPRSLAFTWRSHATNETDSVVRVTFEPDGDATVVEVRHERLLDAAAVRDHTAGWTEIIDGFARAMETAGAG